MKTKNGIELNLKESNYIYNFKGLSFIFSSEFYLKKFKDNVNKYIHEETLKIKLKYGININLEMYLAISCYQKIEKRGFYILNNKIELKKDAIFINVINLG